MSRKLAVLCLGLAVLAGTASTAQAATAVVGAARCALVQGGQATVPSGSTVTIRVGYAEETRGILEALLASQTTTLTVNGTTVDLTDALSAPVQAPNGSWSSLALYDTGITLGAGQTLSFTENSTFAHSFPEVMLPTFDSSPGIPVFDAAGPQPPLSCTVTGV